MSKILTVAIRKGGSGKTTTAVNVASALQLTGHPTLLVDLDQSANATMQGHQSLYASPVYGNTLH